MIHAGLSLDDGTDELKVMVAHFEAHGIKMSSTVTHGITNGVYFTDSDGHRLEIYSEVFATHDERLPYMRAQESTASLTPSRSSA